MAQPRTNAFPSPALRNRATSSARAEVPKRRPRVTLGAGAQRGLTKFLNYFPEGFRDPLYADWERGYKWAAHKRWFETLDQANFRKLLIDKKHEEIAARAVAIEARTNLLFSFEKMALRDALKPVEGARAFAQGLYDFLHGPHDMEERFIQWCEVVAALPRRQTRVLTWPVVTVLGFIAQPKQHIFLKPTVTRRAANALGLRFEYRSRPSWEIYSGLLRLAGAVREDVRDLRPRDMIDIQSFLWVQGSDEYPQHH
jgi:hypothetical protein